MAWSQSDVDTLKAAIATGVRTVEYQDRSVTYQDIPAMLQALSVMQAEVALGGSATATRTRYASTSKGL